MNWADFIAMFDALNPELQELLIDHMETLWDEQRTEERAAKRAAAWA